VLDNVLHNSLSFHTDLWVCVHTHMYVLFRTFTSFKNI
jgi:hypothetical protein